MRSSGTPLDVFVPYLQQLDTATLFEAFTSLERDALFPLLLDAAREADVQGQPGMEGVVRELEVVRGLGEERRRRVVEGEGVGVDEVRPILAVSLDGFLIGRGQLGTRERSGVREARRRETNEGM